MNAYNNPSSSVVVAPGLTQHAIVVTLAHTAGSLASVLSIFTSHGINVHEIRSKPSMHSSGDYDLHLEFMANVNDPALTQMIEDLRPKVKALRSFGSNSAPWFPRRIEDLDSFAHKTLDAGGDLESDHPGFSDEVYRARRLEIVDIAKNYRHGMQIPRIDYTDVEKETWKVCYEKLTALYPTHACSQYLASLPELERNCGYSANNIPQLEDISSYLKKRTGFSLRPVSGLLSARDFLNGLAFRVFHSTQYIRHHSKPLYTPEPDICHELMGHVPMFCDPDFAEFSQQIGLASLGASDDDITKLATLYWFTVEFGVTKQGGELKAYGAGLLSSFGELEYALSDQPKLLPFDPPTTSQTEYPITTYQPTYFVCESFRSMTEKVRTYAQGIKRSFTPRFNSWTMEVELLDTPMKLICVLNEISDDLRMVQNALRLSMDE